MTKHTFSLGMTSVTFRKKSIAEIAEIAGKAGLSQIEWGGDIHIKPNDFQAVETALAEMKKYNITCPSYGSYYRIGDRDFDAARSVFETAQALGAGIVRMWLGRKGSADCTKEETESMIGEIRELAALACPYHLDIAFEFHGGTYNDSGKSAVSFNRACACPHVRSYWQPLAFGNAEENLKAVIPFLCTVHVFEWDKENRRFPLETGKERWLSFLSVLKKADCYPNLIMEFTAEDSEKQFLRDAAVLHTLANEMI